MVKKERDDLLQRYWNEGLRMKRVCQIITLLCLGLVTCGCASSEKEGADAASRKLEMDKIYLMNDAMERAVDGEADERKSEM